MVTFSTDLLSGVSGVSCSLFGVVAARYRYFIFMFCCVCCILVVFLDPVWLCDNLAVKEGAECYVVSLVCVWCTICPGLFALSLDDIGRLCSLTVTLHGPYAGLFLRIPVCFPANPTYAEKKGLLLKEWIFTQEEHIFTLRVHVVIYPEWRQHSLDRVAFIESVSIHLKLYI